MSNVFAPSIIAEAVAASTISAGKVTADGPGFSVVEDALVNLDNEVESGGNVVAMTNTKPSGDKFAQLLGASGDYYSTPNAAANQITGDIDLQVHLSPDDWTPAALGVILSKWASSNASYQMLLNANGSIGISTVNSSSTQLGSSSTAATGFTDGSAHWVRATVSQSLGVANYYTSEDGDSWTQLGDADVAHNNTDIRAGSALILIGANNAGVNNLDGTVRRAKIYNGIQENGGALAVDFNPNDYANTGNTNWSSSATGEVWTIQGNNYVVTPRALVGTGAPWGDLPGVAGDYFSTPDSVANSVTGDIDIRVKVAMDDWTPAVSQVILSKLGSTGQYSYDFYINTTGKFVLLTSPDGTAVSSSTATSSAATGIADGVARWIRVTRVSSTGAVKFYTSSDGAAWTQLGTDVSNTAGAIFDSTIEVRVGLDTGNPLAGKVHRAQILKGIDGPVVVDLDPIMHTNGTTFYGRTGETWTANGNAAIHGYDVNTVVGTGANLRKSVSGAALLYGATGDDISTPDSVANSPTGSFSGEFIGCSIDWATQEKPFIGKRASGSSFQLTTGSAGNAGKIRFFWWESTVLKQIALTSSIGFSNGEEQSMAFEFDSADGSFSVYKSSDLGANWVLVETVAGAGATSIDDTSSIFELFSEGSGGFSKGLLKRARFWKNADRSGAAAVDFNATDAGNTGATSFPSSTTGETWTLNGNTFIQNTGHDVVHSIGSAGLESTAGQTIASPGTVFAVARISNLTSSNNYLIDARSNAGARMAVSGTTLALNKFQILQGTTAASMAESADNNPHVFTGQFNGDPTTKLTVSGIGNVTADVGPDDWDYGTLFAALDGSSGMQGYIAQLIVFDRALSETEIQAVQGYLQSKYAV